MFCSVALHFLTDSSDGEEPETPKVVVNLHRKMVRDDNNVLELPEDQFIRKFRVNKEVFLIILDEISPKLSHGLRSTHLPAPTRLARFLAFVATGISAKDKEFSKLMSKSGVSRTINEIIDIFAEHLSPKWLGLEQTEEEELLTKQFFHNFFGIPGIMGCVKNTQIQIKTPDKEIKNLYINQSGVASLNVMIVCDHNKLIKFLDAGQPGNYQDAQIWEQSKAEQVFRSNYLSGKINSYLVGNSAYKLLPYLMVPYRNPKEKHEKFFNEKLSKISETIDQCIFELKNHFSCLKSSTGLYYTPEKAEKTIISCCILHNICMKYKYSWRNPSLNPESFSYTENSTDYDQIIETNSEECIESRTLRDEIALQSFIAYTIPKTAHFINRESNDINRLRESTALLDYSDVKFLRTFGVSKKVFSVLLEEIKPNMKVAYRNTHTPASIRLATYLEFLTTGAQIKQLGLEYTTTVSKCHISKVIVEMMELFDEHLSAKWINLDQTLDEENTAKQHFYNATGLPGIIGCVDNIHIPIKTPCKDLKKLYLNRKDICSLNVMIICDHNMVIKYVDANQPGSYSDAYVWDQSSADNYFNRNYLNGKTDTWVLGDLAFKLQPYLMTPYKDANQTHEYEFNYKHFEARKIIKNCVDILRNRFKCLTAEAGIQYTPEKASKIIRACCILHNICITHKNYWQPCDFSLESLNDSDAEENVAEAPNIECANYIRDQIARNLDIYSYMNI